MHILLITLFAILSFSAHPKAAKPKSNCQECVYYSFEDDFSSLFRDDGICSRYEVWLKNDYVRAGLTPPNENSRSFITPQYDYSCTTSFPFTMAGGGTVEVVVYMDPSSEIWWTISDVVSVMAIEMMEDGSYFTHGRAALSASVEGFVSGWQSFYIPILGSTTFNGHLNFVGRFNPGSWVAVEAFCYKPPNYKGDCWAPDDSPTTVTSETTAMEIDTTTEMASTLSTDSITEPTPATATTLSEVTSTAFPSITVLKPTLPTLAPGTLTSCPEDQTIHWLLPHEENCNLFYYCVWGQKVQRVCPSGLHFNTEIQVCDWPLSAGCTLNQIKSYEFYL